MKRVKFRKGIKRVNKSLGAKEVKDGGRLHVLKSFTKTQPEDKKKKKKKLESNNTLQRKVKQNHIDFMRIVMQL